MFNKKSYIKNCWVNLYKPSGMASSACAFKIRKTLTDYFRGRGIMSQNEKLPVGHMGTLDPMAEGIIPIAIAEATKTIPAHEGGLKTYSFTIKWGVQTETDDATGQIVNVCEKIPTDAEIEKAIPKFIGTIRQTPSKFSAIHIAGRRAYDLARDGRDFEMPSRAVFVKELSLEKSWSENFSAAKNTSEQKSRRAKNHFSTLEVTCGQGTYVRTLAHDIADRLGTFGHLVKLVRTRNGYFASSDSITLEKFLAFFENLQHTGQAKAIGSPDSALQDEDVRIAEFLKPIDYKLDGIPVIIITPQDTAKFEKGACFKSDYPDGFYKIYAPRDSEMSRENENFFIGFAEVKNKTLQPKKVINAFEKN